MQNLSSWEKEHKAKNRSRDGYASAMAERSGRWQDRVEVRSRAFIHRPHALYIRSQVLRLVSNDSSFSCGVTNLPSHWLLSLFFLETHGQKLWRIYVSTFGVSTISPTFFFSRPR